MALQDDEDEELGADTAFVEGSNVTVYKQCGIQDACSVGCEFTVAGTE